LKKATPSLGHDTCESIPSMNTDKATFAARNGRSNTTETTNIAGDTADDESCGSQSLHFPVITKPRQFTNQ